LVWPGNSYSPTWVCTTPHTEGIANAVIGLVHSGRIERHKQDTTVYGISTDSITFNLYRINRQSKWCSKTWTWGYTDRENKEIIGRLLKIFSEASEQSPVDVTTRRHHISSSAGDDKPLDVAMGGV
jgi:hypothetical protein